MRAHRHFHNIIFFDVLRSPTSDLSRNPQFGTVFEAHVIPLEQLHLIIRILFKGQKQTKLLWMPFVREGCWTVNLLIVDCNTDNSFWDDTINT